jgi:hypothetical protein
MEQGGQEDAIFQKSFCAWLSWFILLPWTSPVKTADTQGTVTDIMPRDNLLLAINNKSPRTPRVVTEDIFMHSILSVLHFMGERCVRFD